MCLATITGPRSALALVYTEAKISTFLVFNN